jgi:hypothetical protein
MGTNNKNVDEHKRRLTYPSAAIRKLKHHSCQVAENTEGHEISDIGTEKKDVVSLSAKEYVASENSKGCPGEDA